MWKQPRRTTQTSPGISRIKTNTSDAAPNSVGITPARVSSELSQTCPRRMAQAVGICCTQNRPEEAEPAALSD